MSVFRYPSGLSESFGAAHHAGPRPVRVTWKPVVWCPKCKTRITVAQDQGMVQCTNPECRCVLQVSAPTYQRGGTK